MPRFKVRLTISFTLAFILLPLQLFSPFIASARPVSSKVSVQHENAHPNPAPKPSVPAKANKTDVTGAAQIKNSYGKLPLRFEPDANSSSSGRRFISHGAGYSLSLSRTGLSLKLESGDPQGKDDLITRPAARNAHDDSHKSLSLNMNLLGSNSASKPEAIDELPGKTNYFIGKNPSHWRINIPTYAKVRYEEIYKGVDLIYYGNQNQLEYDFIVAPGADTGAISLSFDGAQKLSINKRGDLVLSTKAGRVVQHKPVIYQQDGDSKRTIDGSYQLRGHQRIGFSLGKYDPTKPLVIDPTLVYSNVFGGTQENQSAGIAVDSAGNAYLTGWTYSGNFPVVNPLQGMKGYQDAFVSKLNADGTALIYSTYIGGEGGDQAYAIAVDNSGNAYVTGTTNGDFPTTPGAYQQDPADSQDAFVLKLRSDGAAIDYATYLGGVSSNIFGDYGYGIAVDSAGDAYVTGATYGTFPTTPGAFRTTSGSVPDAFISKLNADGTALVYSSFLGGNSADVARAVALDGSGNAYVTGFTFSTDFPTVNPFQGSYGGTGQDPSSTPAGDAFITKIKSDGSAIVYSSYLGGDSIDYGYGVAVDGSGNAYLTGKTYSDNFPTTQGSLKPVKTQSSLNAFVTKVGSTGNISYSTFLGGNSSAEGDAIALDEFGNAYVTGYAASDFPQVNPVQTGFGGGGLDAFMAKLNASGSALILSTFLGGGSNDRGSGIAVDSIGNVYVTGTTPSADFPQIPQTDHTISSNGEIFVCKIGSPQTPTPRPFSITTIAPNKGGDTGGVTVNITGDEFDANATVKLARAGQPDIPGLGVAVKFISGYAILRATFDLHGKQQGDWDVVVTNPDNSTATLPQGFKIEEGKAPQVSGSILGRTKIRGGLEQTYNITFGNRGNVNAVGVLVKINFPKFLKWRLGVDIPRMTDDPNNPIFPPNLFPNFGLVDFSKVPTTYESGDNLVLPLMLPIISPGQSLTIPIKFTSPDDPEYGHRLFDLSVTTLPPLFKDGPAPGGNNAVIGQRCNSAMPMPDGKRSPSYNCFPSSDPQAVACLMSIVNLIFTALGLGDLISCLGALAATVVNFLWGLLGVLCNGESTSFVGYDSPVARFMMDILLFVVGSGVGIAYQCAYKLFGAYAYLYVAKLLARLSGIGLAITLIQVALAASDAITSCFYLLDYFNHIENVTSNDPNDKFGPVGVGAQHYTAAGQSLGYGIYFENKPDASAPAQRVTVSDQLDPSLVDLSSVSLGPITVGNRQVTPPPGLADFNADVDLRPGNNLFLRVSAHLDKDTGLLTWLFTSIDPDTGEPTDDPIAGFLPPDVHSPEGEASVFFNVTPKQNLTTDTPVANQARIVFDNNPYIDTPVWSNTIDNVKPTSQVLSLSASQTSCNFNVQWSGADTGSGVQSYNIYVSEDGGPFNLWLRNSMVTSAIFSGQPNKSYSFFSIAEDNTGNMEDAKTIAEATTSTPPSAEQFSSTDYYVSEGDGSAAITVTRIGDTSNPATVQYATGDGTALSGRDYESVSGTLNFAAGESSKTFYVPIIPNSLVDNQRTVNLTLSNPTGGDVLSTPQTAHLTIADDDGTAATSVGSLVTVQLGNITVTYTSVSQAGATVATAVDPNAQGQLPNGYTAPGPAYDLYTDAAHSGPIQVCFYLPSVTDPSVFAQLRVLHGENGSLVNRTTSASADNRTICATVDSLSPFVIARSPAGPTSAPASISGRITTTDGSPLGGVALSLLGGQTSARAITDADGNYSFARVETGDFYSIAPSRANYTFSPANLTFSLTADKTDATFTAFANAEQSANPLDADLFFVRQHYLDFLSREPDAGGLEYWATQLDQCNGEDACLRRRRIDVSAAFFIEAEFQQTGFFVYRLYKGALGRHVSYAEFAQDRRQIIAGYNLEESKAAFASAFVEREEFRQRYASATTAGSFVDALVETMRESSGVDLSARRAALIAAYGLGSSLSESRSLAVRQAVEDGSFRQAEYNPSFVLMQYFGYLKRDADEGGYEFWLNVLNNREPNNYRGMVCSFITSAEYQKRFSTVATRSNADCR